MKNYRELFNAFNQQLIKRTRIKQIIVACFVGIIIPFCSTGAYYLTKKAYMLADLTTSKVAEPLAIAFALGLFLILFLFLSDKPRFRKLFTKELNNRATDFALTHYYENVIKALESRFTVSNDFKEKLKVIIDKHTWFEYFMLTFEHNDDIFLDWKHDMNESLIIREDQDVLYLSYWNYEEGKPFEFIFDKIAPNGAITEEKYILPKITE
jgi:hypothetical protein